MEMATKRKPRNPTIISTRNSIIIMNLKSRINKWKHEKILNIHNLALQIFGPTRLWYVQPWRWVSGMNYVPITIKVEFSTQPFREFFSFSLHNHLYVYISSSRRFTSVNLNSTSSSASRLNLPWTKIPIPQRLFSNKNKKKYNITFSFVFLFNMIMKASCQFSFQISTLQNQNTIHLPRVTDFECTNNCSSFVR